VRIFRAFERRSRNAARCPAHRDAIKRSRPLSLLSFFSFVFGHPVMSLSVRFTVIQHFKWLMMKKKIKNEKQI
jgi:hypothetical protein